MKLAYFDCFSGISGDMTLGALVDAGVSLEQLRAELLDLNVPGWEMAAEKVWKNGMSATYVKVRTEDTQTHRSLSTILDIFEKSKLLQAVKDRAAAIFENWARRRPRSMTCRWRKFISMKWALSTPSWISLAPASVSRCWGLISLPVLR